MPEGKSFVVIKGDGLAVQWPVLLTDILFYCSADGNQCLIYDGLDVTSGKFFCRLQGANDRSYHVGLGEGVEFSSGIYVDQSGTSDECTICFRSLA